MTIYLISIFLITLAYSGAGYLLFRTLQTVQAEKVELMDRLYVSKGQAPVGQPAAQTRGAQSVSTATARPKVVGPIDAWQSEQAEKEAKETR